MHIKAAVTVLATLLAVAPLSAQVRPRTDGRRTADGSIIRSDGSVVRPDGSILRPDGSVVRASNGSVSRGSSRIPPGQLPPRGMCRVWIDGVPPGQQPPVTDCATAERNRVANSRVIYGDRESFPGRGKGRTGTANTGTNCTFRDAVVVSGRVVDVCRDANGNVIDTRGKRSRDGRLDRRDRDDDDLFDDDHDSRKSEAKALKKANKEAAKAARKRGKGHGDN